MTRSLCAVRLWRRCVCVCVCGRRGTHGLAVGVAISLSHSRPRARSLPACTPTAPPRAPQPLSSPRPPSRAARLARTRLPPTLPHASTHEHAHAPARHEQPERAPARPSARPPVSRLETVDRYNRNARAVPSSFAPRIRSLPHQLLARGNLCVCAVRAIVRACARSFAGGAPAAVAGERAHTRRARFVPTRGTFFRRARRWGRGCRASASSRRRRPCRRCSHCACRAS